MEIQDIKQNLPLANVLQHYNLKLTKHEALVKCAALAGSQKLEGGSIKPQTKQTSNIPRSRRNPFVW